MKTKLKLIGSLIVLICSVIVVSCMLPEDNIQSTSPAQAFNGEICDGKKILSFSSMGALQQAHLNLYQQYQINNEDEQVLVNYEISTNFYSLRKKDQDMDDGIIPNDPDFDATNFTFDPILETLLNEDGMIIIAGRLYLWDSGCVIHSIPFSCENYANLLSFYHAARSNSIDAMHAIYFDNKMNNINICDNKTFDFEGISENGGRIEEGGVPRKKNKNGCGYDVVINNKLVSCAGGFHTYELSYENITPIGSTSPFNLFYVRPTFGDAADIEFYNSVTGVWEAIPLSNQEVNYGYLLPITGGSFLMRVDESLTNMFDVSLVSSVNLVTGNSCQAMNTTTIDNSCPFAITAVKNYVSETEASWTFTINQTPGCNIGGSKVVWNFGDGTPSVTGGFSVTHVYSVPCAMQYVNVTAIVEGPICGTTNKLLTKTDIPYGNPCTRSTYTFPSHKDHYGGKKVTLRAKLKRNMFGKSVFKAKYKNRILGDKTIKHIGNIYSPTANNGSCMSNNIASIVPSKTTSGKKRNKQKEKYSTFYHINAMDKYQVQFIHSSGYMHTLTADDLYCGQ